MVYDCFIIFLVANESLWRKKTLQIEKYCLCFGSEVDTPAHSQAQIVVGFILGFVANKKNTN